MFSLWWLPVPNAAAHRLIMSSGESPPPRMLRSSYRGALIGSACQQAHLLETEDRTGSAPKAWEHRLVKCAPRHGVSAGSKAASASALRGSKNIKGGSINRVVNGFAGLHQSAPLDFGRDAKNEKREGRLSAKCSHDRICQVHKNFHKNFHTQALRGGERSPGLQSRRRARGAALLVTGFPHKQTSKARFPGPRAGASEGPSARCVSPAHLPPAAAAAAAAAAAPRSPARAHTVSPSMCATWLGTAWRGRYHLREAATAQRTRPTVRWPTAYTSLCRSSRPTRWLCRQQQPRAPVILHRVGLPPAVLFAGSRSHTLPRWAVRPALRWRWPRPSVRQVRHTGRRRADQAISSTTLGRSRWANTWTTWTATGHSPVGPVPPR